MKTKTLYRSLIAIVALLIAAPVSAAEMVRVEGQVRENIPAGPFLAGAYAFIWVALLVYVAIIARRLGRVQSEIRDLRGKIDKR